MSNQLVKANNVVLSNPGLVQSSSDSTAKHTSAPTTMTHAQAGNGAFIFNSQFNVDTDGTTVITNSNYSVPNR